MRPTPGDRLLLTVTLAVLGVALGCTPPRPSSMTGASAHDPDEAPRRGHGVPVDSFDLVSIGSRRVEDIADEGMPCLQGDNLLPAERLILFSDSTIFQRRVIRPRCRSHAPRPQFAADTFGGMSSVFTRHGDTLVASSPIDDGGRETWFQETLTTDSILPSNPSDTSGKRYVRLSERPLRAPPIARAWDAVVGDTFDLVTFLVHPIGRFVRTGPCVPWKGVDAERLIVLSSREIQREWVDRPTCRTGHAPGDTIHSVVSAYRLQYDTLTVFEGDGAVGLAWLVGRISGDSLQQIFIDREQERRYVRRPHHASAPRSPLRRLATDLVHALNPAITSVDIVEILAPTNNAPKRAVLLYGVRDDRTFRGDLGDELYVIVQADVALTQIERTVAVIPSKRWLDFDVLLTGVAGDSVGAFELRLRTPRIPGQGLTVPGWSGRYPW